MKLSIYKSYDDLPLFLNARTVANVLGVSISSAYELMHEPDFPTLKVGSRLAVPRDAFRQWAERKAGGAKCENRTGPGGTPSRTTSLSPMRSTPWGCLPGPSRSTVS